MLPEFVGRQQELSLLEKEYSKESSVAVITGRPGMGKTRLIREFIGTKNAMYFRAAPQNTVSLIDDFSSSINRYYSGRIGDFSTWEEAFEAYSGHSDNKKILVLDEFENILNAEPSFLRKLRDIWDTMLSDRNVMLILCGSNIPLMTSIETDRDGPFFGRISRTVVLEPIPFAESMIAEDYVSSVERYAVTGGNPACMRAFGTEPVMESVKNIAMDPDSVLFGYPEKILSGEVREPSVYISILKAIASGNRRITQISSAVGIAATTLNAYLRKLSDLRIVERTVPVTEYFPEKSKNGIYRIRDRYTALWLRSILPHMSDLISGERRWAHSEFDAEFASYIVRPVFADICTESVRSLSDEIGFLPIRVGRYWNRDAEIDILALNPSKRRAFVAKCFFESGNVGRKELDSLISEAGKVPELRGFVVKIGLFTTGGFDRDLMKEKNVLLVSCGNVVKH